jgi:hypothetical protein
MDPKGVCHVRDFILLISNVVKLGHWTLILDIGFGGSSETGFGEATL